MNIHEYQAKTILRRCNVPVPSAIVADTPGKAREAAERIREQTGTDTWAVKAQIHAGGRGKEEESRSPNLSMRLLSMPVIFWE